MTRLFPTLLALALALACGGTTAQTNVQHLFRFAVGDPDAHVTARFSGLQQDVLRLALPGFVPGASRYRDLAAAQRGFVVRAHSRDEARGPAHDRQLEVTRAGALFVVKTGGAAQVHVEYTLSMTGRRLVRGLGRRSPCKVEKDGETITMRYHEAFVLQGPLTWLYAVGQEGAPQTVRFELPEGYAVASPLPRAKDGGYAGADYHQLVDAPFHLGRFETHEFTVAGRKHQLLLSGFGRDRRDRRDLCSWIGKILTSQNHSLGPPPYANYSLFFGCQSAAAMAIGHRNSAEVITNSLAALPTLQRNISRAHIWTLVRAHMHPREHDQMDYRRPRSTRQAWFALGATEYLAELSLVRAGLVDARQFWTRDIATHVNAVQRDSRRLEVSVADAGANMFADDRKRRGAGPDPRRKGLLLALLLDIEIRLRTAQQKSFDDVVRDLAQRCRATGKGYTGAEIRAACEKTAGSSFEDFFARYVDGTQELPITRTLARLGLDAQAVQPKQPTRKRDPRTPVPKGKRPPLWRIRFIEKPGKEVLRFRTAMTKVVVK